MHTKGWQRALGFVIWLLVGLSAAYWGLRLGESRPSVAEPVVAKLPGVDPAAVVAALGGAPAPVAASTAPAAAKRLDLLGVIAEGRRGVALLSIDGQPGKPYLVGSNVEEGLVLKAVGPRHAELAATAGGATTQRLELPLDAPAELPAGLKMVGVQRP